MNHADEDLPCMMSEHKKTIKIKLPDYNVIIDLLQNPQPENDEMKKLMGLLNDKE